MVYTSALVREAVLYDTERRILKIHTKLHQWAIDSPDHRFDGLFNVVADPAFLMVTWDRVRAIEDPVPINWHARFGGRIRETNPGQPGHRTLVRPNPPRGYHT